ncbi:MAG: hypothetical protein MUC31_02090 [Bacteroidales bacterium]|jgi:hypothetical protein|nr:hypothetical protein [Bacteroidales bacterium]
MNFEREISGKSAYVVSIILIILLSFRLFSTIYYPSVNSDEGVIVLMLHYFKLPGDLYFWGQDRYGGIIPLLGQVPFRLLGLSSLISETIIHYIILISGFLAFSAFIRSKTNKIIFALVWFLPPIYYTDLLRNVFGLQYSLTAILLFLITRYLPSYQTRKLISKLPFYFLLLAVTVILFWVSELAVTSILAILIVSFFFLLKDQKLTALFRKPEPYILITGLFLVWLVISRLKNLVEPSPYDQYGEKWLNDFQGIYHAIALLLSSVVSVLTFRVPDFLFSLYAWLCLALFMLIIVFRKKIFAGQGDVRLATVFILDAVILVAVILVSHWALMNDMPRRYFVGFHISSWLAFLLIMGSFREGRVKTTLTVFAFLVAGTGTVSTVYSYRYIHPKTFRSRAETALEFTQLGKTGIISDYWNSYSSSFADPDMIKATPYELSYSVRNLRLVDSVFAQPRIILIKDLWMDEFPDSLVQFDRTLIRKDSSFSLGGCRANEYIVKKDWIFNVGDLVHPAEIAEFEHALGREVVRVGKGYEKWIYGYIVHGPYMTLPKGRYEVSFNLGFDSLFVKDKYLAILDVASDFGNRKIATLPVSSTIIPSLNDFHEYKLEFKLEERDQNIEFRIYYLGGAYLALDRIVLREIPE